MGSRYSYTDEFNHEAAELVRTSDRPEVLDCGIVGPVRCCTSDLDRQRRM